MPAISSREDLHLVRRAGTADYKFSQNVEFRVDTRRRRIRLGVANERHQTGGLEPERDEVRRRLQEQRLSG